MSAEQDLQATLQQGLGSVTVEWLTDAVGRVMVPNPRYLHDSVMVTIEARSDGLYRLTDAGDLASTYDSDFDELIGVLHCSGSPVTADGGLAVLDTEQESLAASILSFAHAIIAAPTVWNALNCAEDGHERPPAAESPTKRMARTCRDHLLEQIGRQYRPMFLLNERLTGREGWSTSVPLALRPRRSMPPQLLTGFISHQTAQSTDAGRKAISFMWDVVRDLNVPKYVVVDSTNHVPEYQDFYDEANISVVAEGQYEPIVNDARSALRDAGLNL